MKKNKHEINLREKIYDVQKRLETQTVTVGKLSVRLTSALIYFCCLLCAVFIWINVTEDNSVKIIRRFDNISVALEGESALLKKDMAVFEIVDKFVSVTVSGNENKVNDLRDEDVVVYVDVKKVDEVGMLRLDVKVKNIGKLDAVTSPSSIKVFVDKTDEIDVPVVVNKTYSISSDYSFDVKTDVDSIQVSGALSVLEKIKEARVNAQLGEITGSSTFTAPIMLVDENGSKITTDYITPSVTNVIVDVDVFTEKTVPLIVSYKYGYINQKNISVKLNPEEITLRGDPALLSKVQHIVLPEIDERELTANKTKVVDLVLPEGITDVNSPEQFIVEIELVNTVSDSLTIPANKIKVINAPSDIKYSLPDEFVLNYIADKASAKKVSANNFSVEIDLSALSDSDGDNVYEVMPEITVKDANFTLYPVKVDEVEIKIVEVED